MTAVSEINRDLLLASMRVASLNLKGWANEIDAVGIALRDGTLSIDGALTWLDDIGVLYWLPESAEQDGAS